MRFRRGRRGFGRLRYGRRHGLRRAIRRHRRMHRLMHRRRRGRAGRRLRIGFRL